MFIVHSQSRIILNPEAQQWPSYTSQMGPCGPPINVIPSPGSGYKQPHKQAPSASEKDTKGKRHAGYRLSFLLNLRNNLLSAVQLRSANPSLSIHPSLPLDLSWIELFSLLVTLSFYLGLDLSIYFLISRDLFLLFKFLYCNFTCHWKKSRFICFS